MLQIAIVNGPNLNLLGKREPHIYGNQSFDDYLIGLKTKFGNCTIHYYQSNIEGELINYLHGCMGKMDGIIINPGGYAHTSIALADAVHAIGIPVLEVHISNIYSREEYRHKSITASKCVGAIAGLGLFGYQLGLQFFLEKAENQSNN